MPTYKITWERTITATSEIFADDEKQARELAEKGKDFGFRVVDHGSDWGQQGHPGFSIKSIQQIRTRLDNALEEFRKKL